MKSFFYHFLVFALAFSWQTLPGQNVGLHFDGCSDFISLGPTPAISGWTANTDFTVEIWFTAPASDVQTCGSNFRRLFVVSIPDRFEVGRCNGDLKIYWSAAPGSPGVVNIPPPSGITINDGLWHCIGVRRMASPASVEVYLDGVLAYANTAQAPAILNATLFRLGHWHGFLTCTPPPEQDWIGNMDEVRLWRTALPTSEMLAPCRHCVRTGSETDLVAYWRLDDGVPGQSNVGITTVADCTPFNNDGVLYPTANGGHDLTDPDGNFEAGVPIPQLIYPEYTKLTLEIQNAGPAPINLTEICSGDPIRVCLKDAAGNIPPPGSPLAPVITWECDDGSNTWPQVPYNGFSPTQFCFQVPPGNVNASNCNSPSQGYEDKFFRAKFDVTDPVSGKACTYYSSIYPLRICCEVPQPTVSVAAVVVSPPPPGPVPPNGTLCEGDQVTLTVNLTGIPWFPPTGNPVVTVDWCIDDGVNLYPLNQPPLTTQFSVPWTVAVGATKICVRAKIQNCACPAVTAEFCIPVDPMPICGDIIGCDPALMPVPCPAGSPSDMVCYEICRGEDAKICFNQPFSNCIPNWEFSFTNTAGSWVSLGSSNPIQYTNTLPCDDVGSPYEWIGNQQCIWYRVLCHPLSSPSGCEPCTSNVIQVCLKPWLDPPVVNISTNKICSGSGNFATITATNPPQNPPVNYTWYCNGIVVDGPGPNTTYNATQQGYYWVVITDICGQTVESNHVFLQVCVVVPDISCPLAPNVCATPGQPIFLSGCSSVSSCGGPYTYTWTVNPGAPPLILIPPCDIQHTPPPGGATYTLTVTDGCGCSATVSRTVIPCP